MSKLKNLPEATEVTEDDILYIVGVEDSVDYKLTMQTARRTPSGVIYVDGRYNDQAPFYASIETALVGARALGGKVVIKAFKDADGNPIGLGDESIYDLADEGIYFESEFDVWEKFIRYGIDIDNSDLLYNLTNENLTLDLTN